MINSNTDKLTDLCFHALDVHAKMQDTYAKEGMGEKTREECRPTPGLFIVVSEGERICSYVEGYGGKLLDMLVQLAIQDNAFLGLYEQAVREVKARSVRDKVIDALVDGIAEALRKSGMGKKDDTDNND
jgi:hypothetical protein